MNSFVQSIRNASDYTTTTNGAKTLKSTSSANLDLFARIGSSRGVDLSKGFDLAMAEDPNLALRMLLWVRDVRHGSGERETFRALIKHMENNRDYHELLELMIPKIPEFGRWDDILVFRSSKFKSIAYSVYADALKSGNALAAKWAPREKANKQSDRLIAKELIAHIGCTPKEYRKMIVKLTNCVESQMCASNWDEINFSHVPSVASRRYMKAFSRHTTNYKTYLEALKNGDPTVKINASAIFPHDVLNNLEMMAGDDLQAIEAQWAALPNYMNSKRILPVIDVSSSMDSMVPGTRYSHMHIAISLGMYVAEKNTGPFKDVFLTFATNPALEVIRKGNIRDRYLQIKNANWSGSTDLQAAFNLILNHAIQNDVSQEEMPEIVIIPSDMQFNQADRNWKTNFEAIKGKFDSYGYKMPRLVFWNMSCHRNAQTKSNEHGVSLISGFSPAILQSALSDTEIPEKTPMDTMLETLLVERYSII